MTAAAAAVTADAAACCCGGELPLLCLLLDHLLDEVIKFAVALHAAFSSDLFFWDKFPGPGGGFTFRSGGEL